MPLPVSTQWELIEEVANCAIPIFHELENIATNGELIHEDDTYVKIIDIIRENIFIRACTRFNCNELIPKDTNISDLV